MPLRLLHSTYRRQAFLSPPYYFIYTSSLFRCRILTDDISDDARAAASRLPRRMRRARRVIAARRQCRLLSCSSPPNSRARLLDIISCSLFARLSAQLATRFDAPTGALGTRHEATLPHRRAYTRRSRAHIPLSAGHAHMRFLIASPATAAR